VNLSVAVVTVSDSVSAGTRVDHSGPAVAQRLAALKYHVLPIEVVPDERPAIAGMVQRLADSGKVHAVFTTGGTGIAARDVTPEATRDVIDREIPGIGELMRTKGREHIVTAPLSRALAGSRGKVLVVNLPGSPRGAVESLDAMVELVPHIADLLAGKTEHL